MSTLDVHLDPLMEVPQHMKSLFDIQSNLSKMEG